MTLSDYDSLVILVRIVVLVKQAHQEIPDTKSHARFSDTPQVVLLRIFNFYFTKI